MFYGPPTFAGQERCAIKGSNKEVKKRSPLTSTIINVIPCPHPVYQMQISAG
jgi:hypothetical protein